MANKRPAPSDSTQSPLPDKHQAVAATSPEPCETSTVHDGSAGAASVALPLHAPVSTVLPSSDISHTDVDIVCPTDSSPVDPAVVDVSIAHLLPNDCPQTKQELEELFASDPIAKDVFGVVSATQFWCKTCHSHRGADDKSKTGGNFIAHGTSAGILANAKMHINGRPGDSGSSSHNKQVEIQRKQAAQNEEVASDGVVVMV